MRRMAPFRQLDETRAAQNPGQALELCWQDEQIDFGARVELIESIGIPQQAIDNARPFDGLEHRRQQLVTRSLASHTGCVLPPACDAWPLARRQLRTGRRIDLKRLRCSAAGKECQQLTRAGIKVEVARDLDSAGA